MATTMAMAKTTIATTTMATTTMATTTTTTTSLYKFENARGSLQSHKAFSEYPDGWSHEHLFGHSAFAEFAAPLTNSSQTAAVASYQANIRKKRSMTDVHDLKIGVVCSNRVPFACVCVATLMNEECAACEACHTGKFTVRCENVVDDCTFTNGGPLGDTVQTCDGSKAIHATECYEPKSESNVPVEESNTTTSTGGGNGVRVAVTVALVAVTVGTVLYLRSKSW